MKNPLNNITRENSWKILAILVLSVVIIELSYLAAVFGSGIVIVTENNWGNSFLEYVFNVGEKHRYYVIVNKYAYRIPKWQADLLNSSPSNEGRHTSNRVYVNNNINSKSDYGDSYIYEYNNADKFLLSYKPDDIITLTDVEGLVKVYIHEKAFGPDYYTIEKYNNKTLTISDKDVYQVENNKVYQVYEDGEDYIYYKCILR